MTTITETSPALVDANVRLYIAQVSAGEITETEARWMIASQLLTVGIAEQVAKRTSNLDFRTQEDLAVRLQQIIEQKALDASFLDLDALNTKSASGWARQLAKSAVPFTLKKIITDRLRETAVNPINPDSGFRTSYEELEYHSAPAAGDQFELDNEDTDEDLNDIAEEFEAAALGTRSAHRLGLTATAVRKMYDLPSAIRPEGIIDREWVREAVMADKELAQRSIGGLHALIETQESDEQKQIDKRLHALWDDFTYEQRVLLLEKNPRVAQTLVLAAVAPRSRPNRDVIALALHTLRMGSSDEDVRGYQRFTRDLLNAWVASECAAVSEFDTKGTLSPAKEGERMSAALSWPELAADAAARRGQPFGSDVDQVERYIADIVETLSA